MKAIYIFIIIFIASLLMSSCTERLDIELDETYDRLVVEGNVMTDTMAQSFYLSKTSSYFANEAASKITGADFVINDDLGNSINLTEAVAGQYITPDDFFGIPGRTYQMKINLEKEIGESKTYEASSELMAVDPIDSIGIAFNTLVGRDGFWLVKLYAQDPGGIENFYMFNVYNNGRLMTDTLDKVSFTDDRMFDGNYTYGIGVAYFRNNEDDQPFKIGDTVTLQMAGLNKNQYTYFDEVIRATSFQNPMFGGPPANVKGNISNGAFGYFGAYSTTYSTMIIKEGDIEYIE